MLQKSFIRKLTKAARSPQLVLKETKLRMIQQEKPNALHLFMRVRLLVFESDLINLRGKFGVAFTEKKSTNTISMLMDNVNKFKGAHFTITVNVFSRIPSVCSYN